MAQISWINMRRTDEILKIKEGVFTAPIRWAKTWEELGYINGAYVDNYSQIYEGCDFKSVQECENTFATKEQAARYGIIAAQLSQLVANLNGESDWKPEINEKFYYIGTEKNGLRWGDFITYDKSMIPHFPLKTQAAAEFSLKHHANLWRKFHGI